MLSTEGKRQHEALKKFLKTGNYNDLYAPAITIGRNDPCHCGSGRKYKKCCLNKGISHG